jgi:F-type H+-transporting ATPase subunit b
MRGTLRRLAASVAALCSVLVLFATPVSAQPDEHAAPHGESKAGANEHAVPGHAEHAGGHGHEINFYYGFLGEKAGVEPSLAWRPKGMPPPLGALLVNTAILFYVLGRFGAPKMADALKKRRTSIMAGFDEAARMRSEAQERLEEYTKKLDRIDQEIERVKREMREIGEVERARILEEAREKRARMERDAQLLIEQELKAAHQLLLKDTVTAAVRSAEELLSKQVSISDQQRLVDEYIEELPRALGGVKS